MPETNLALQPVDASTDWESVMIGKSRFTDDVWDLKAYIPAKTLQESHKLLRSVRQWFLFQRRDGCPEVC